MKPGACLLPLIVVAFALDSNPTDAQQVDWRPNGEILSFGVGVTAPGIVPDGNGGAYVVWTENASGFRIHAQRVDGFGRVQWGMSPIEVATASVVGGHLVQGDYFETGVFVSWSVTDGGATYDTRIQRLDINGTSQWTAGGVLVYSGPGFDTITSLASDENDGCFVAVTDNNNGMTPDVALIRRLNPNGTFDWSGWKILNPTAQPGQPSQVVTDQAGGVIAANYMSALGGAYAQRIDGAGNFLWSPAGVRVLSGIINSGFPIVSDGAGGAILSANPSAQLRVSRVSSAGSPLWGSDGLVVTGTGTGVTDVTVIADGSQGAFLAWKQVQSANEIRIQHILANGTLAWSGVRLVQSSAASLARPKLILSGATVIVMWEETHFGATDLMMQKIDANGFPVWSREGYVLAGNIGADGNARLVRDQFDGFIAAWNGTTTETNVHVQRGFTNGLTGDYMAGLDDVMDMPDDQGGWVRLTVSSGPADNGGAGVTGYTAWRLVPPSSVDGVEIAAATPGSLTSVRADFSEVLKSPPAGLRLSPGEARLLGLPIGGTWESVGFHGATQDIEYLLAAPTRDDDVDDSMPEETYAVSVHTLTPGAILVTNTMTGFSVDNLAPQAPEPLLGSLQGSGLLLTWDPNAESDLLHYAVYRGNDSGFTPSPGNRLGTPVSSAWTDPAFDGTQYYKVSAFDRHANESPFTLLSPSGVSGTGSPRAGWFHLGPPVPTPFATGTRLAFDLGSEQNVSLVVFDALGRPVRRVAEQRLEAGHHEYFWNGRSDSGTLVPSGTYFVRLQTSGGQSTVKTARAE